MAVPAIYSPMPRSPRNLGGAVADWLAIGAAAARRRSGARQAEQVTRQAERDAETLRKEARSRPRKRRTSSPSTPSARRAHRQQEIIGLEQTLADKTRALAERLAATDRLEQELRAREQAAREPRAGAPRPPPRAASSSSSSASASCSASPA